MKKIIALITSVVLVLCLLAACGGDTYMSSNGSTTPDGDHPTGSGVVNVYNWGEYIDESLLDEFEAQTGIEVVYRTYENNEQMYSVLKQGGVSYDVVIPSDYMISRMIDEDMLEKIDFENVPNYANILDEYKNAEYDPANEYSVPYAGGVVGIIYNSTMVTEPVDSWSILFDANYSGQILMIDNPRDAIGLALKYLGYSQNTTDAAEIEAAYQLIADANASGAFQGFVMDGIFDKMESGEAAISTYYAGDYLTMLESNPDLKFVVPKEGSNRFMDAMCILKGAENKANAEAFINFMCDVDAATTNAEYIWYTSPVAGVRENLGLDETTDAVMYPDPAVLETCEYFLNLPQETLSLYDSLWVKMKA